MTRECSVCQRPLVFSPSSETYRCAFCQRHGKRKRDREPESPNVTFYEGVQVDST